MLNYKEFELLKDLLEISCIADIAKNSKYEVFEDENEINEIIKELSSRGYLENFILSKKALGELEKYKVKNAVILAAGGDEVSAKSVYSMPKGLFVKDNETLIERQIRQLHEVGIDDITIVIGYKQELFFFLEEKWGVKLLINPDIKKNNIYSLFIAKNKLSQTYILNSDNYFTQNPFSKYEYHAFHATVYKKNTKNELFIEKNDFSRITKVFSGKNSGECVYGHAFFDNNFSKTFKKYLENQIDDFRVCMLFWEEFVYKNIKNLDLYAHKYNDDFVYEFDSISQIQNINTLFLDTVSQKINNTICAVFKCQKEDIKNIQILQKGLTNILFTFEIKDEKYIFRYPGDSSQFFIYRQNECVAQKIAASSGADGTFVYIDDSGMKISKYRQNCINLADIYYKDINFMKEVARKIRLFHEAGQARNDLECYFYDPVKECEKLFFEASKIKGNLFDIFKKEWQEIRLLQKYADMDGFKKTMCHNDINIDNILLSDEGIDIIDWEFAGFNDPGYDFGRVMAGLCYECDDARIDEILEAYFSRPASADEKLHFMAYSAIHNWYYVGWALYKESINESSRDWMIFFYKQSKKLLSWCLLRYEKKYKISREF